MQIYELIRLLLVRLNDGLRHNLMHSLIRIPVNLSGLLFLRLVGIGNDGILFQIYQIHPIINLCHRRQNTVLLFFLPVCFQNPRNQIQQDCTRNAQIQRNHQNRNQVALIIRRYRKGNTNQVFSQRFKNAVVFLSVDFYNSAHHLCSAEVRPRHTDGFQLLSDRILIRCTQDFMGIEICHVKIHALIHRHIAHYGRYIILFDLRQKPHWFDSDLNHLISCAVPGDRIHHAPSLRGVRRDILAHRKTLILQHRLKVLHLLAGVKAVSIVLRFCSAVNFSRRIKQINFVNRHQRRDFLQLLRIIFRFQPRLQNVRHCPRTDNIIFLHRPDQIYLILLIFLNNADRLIQQHL